MRKPHFERTLNGMGEVGPAALPRSISGQPLLANVAVYPLAGGRPFWATTELRSRRCATITARRRPPLHSGMMIELWTEGRHPIRLKAMVSRYVARGFVCTFVAMTERTTRRLRQLVA